MRLVGHRIALTDCVCEHVTRVDCVSLSLPQVTKEEEFFSLSHCQLLELISQDSLKVLCESEVWI